MNDTQGMTWLLAYTAPRMEFAVEQNLARQKITTFLPFEWVQKKRMLPNRDRFKLVWTREAYFPNYVFVGLAGRDQAVYHIKETDGVAGMVCQEGSPVIVSLQIMEQLMQHADETGLVARRSLPERQKFASGQAVKFIEESPFASLFAEVIVDKGHRIRILMDILGEKRPWDVSPDVLIAV